MSEKQRGKRQVDRPRTPPSNAQSQTARSQQNSLTPRTRREGGGAVPLPHLRVPIAELMQHEMLTCSVETFFNHYAPFCPSPKTVDYVYERVKEDCLVEPKGTRESPAKDGPGWVAFDGGGPADFSQGEPKVFAKLVEIMEVLHELDLKEHEPGRQLNFLYKDAPNSLVGGEIKGSETFKFDACLRPKYADPKKIYGAEAAVIAEFKLEAKQDLIQKNRGQLVSAASQIMNDDPRRMWMYGITIENEEMSLWYFSRSHSVKSKAFDWTRDFKTFSRAFVSFMFATEKEMGFDPTVHRVKVNGEIRYVYQVDDRFFLTVESIFNPRVLCISGRKTRVWRAVEVRGSSEEDVKTPVNGKEYAVKDVWLDEGSDTEGGILRKIFASLEKQTAAEYKGQISDVLYHKLEDALDYKHYKQYFMEIVCDTQGETTKSPARGAVADPTILDMSPMEQTEDQVNKSIRKGSTLNTRTSRHSGLSGSPHQSNANPPDRDHAAKRQYRLVYDDIGIPLHDAPNLGSCFDALSDTLIALVLMLFASWVHRDISTGNILLLQSNDGTFRGKLSDLEYAKEYNSDPVGSKDPKTGTPYFMPYEVHANDRIHAIRPRLPFSSRSLSRRLKAEELDESASRPLFYRYEYDVESLWWIIVWTLITRIPHRPAQKLSRDLFTYTSMPSPTRVRVFKNPADPAIKVAMPPALKSLAASIRTMHDVLYGSYEIIPATFEEYLLTHSGMWDLLEEMFGEVKEKGIKNLVLSDPDSCLSESDSNGASTSTLPTPIGEKRQRDAGGDNVEEENVAEQGEAGGSQKRPRIQLGNGTVTESANPGKFTHHVHKP